MEAELDVKFKMEFKMNFYVFFDRDRFPGFYGVFYEP
jgi:hypothetical protein